VTGRLELSRAQRRAVGQRLGQIEADLGTLCSEGAPGEVAAELARVLARIREETEAIAPRPPPNRLRAVAAHLVVVAGELAPRRMAGYGTVSPEAADYFAGASRRLEALGLRLVAEIEARGGPAR
jgi:hypothetical protein